MSPHDPRTWTILQNPTVRNTTTGIVGGMGDHKEGHPHPGDEDGDLRLCDGAGRGVRLLSGAPGPREGRGAMIGGAHCFLRRRHQIFHFINYANDYAINPKSLRYTRFDSAL